MEVSLQVVEQSVISMSCFKIKGRDHSTRYIHSRTIGTSGVAFHTTSVISMDSL